MKARIAVLAVLGSALFVSPAIGATSGGLGGDLGGVDPTATGSGQLLRSVVATWYGPGLYGNGMACGGRLTPHTHGIAHLRLPCGSRVVIRYGGRRVVTRVIDRGPYGGTAQVDLAAGTARQLGMTGTETVGFRVL